LAEKGFGKLQAIFRGKYQAKKFILVWLILIMPFKRNRNLKTEINTGFGAASAYSAGRYFNREGGPNIAKRGVNILNRYSWYHTMLEMSRTKFLILIFLFYILINLVFAGIYYVIGVEHLAGLNLTNNSFAEVFFFSTQTFTTVGYGRIAPVGFFTSAVATLEAFLGLLSFAIATGLFYGRFSRPRAFLKFSDHALISPYQEGIALMFRMAPFKDNRLSDAEVKLTLALRLEENGKLTNKFFGLDTEISKVNALALSWTVVHPINEKSPLSEMTAEDLVSTNAEVLVFVKAYDDVFANTVMSRTSYVASEVIWGGKFKIMYYPNDERTMTILDLDMINDYDRVNLPQPAGTS
jgi:inward rectifier potassium channel